MLQPANLKTLVQLVDTVMATTAVSEFLGRSTLHGIGDLYDSRKNKLLVLEQYSIAPNTVTVRYISRTPEFTPPSFEFPEIIVCPYGWPERLSKAIVDKWNCGDKAEELFWDLDFSYFTPGQLVGITSANLDHIGVLKTEKLTDLSPQNRTIQCLEANNMTRDEAFWESAHKYRGRRMFTSRGSCFVWEIMDDRSEYIGDSWDYGSYMSEILFIFNGAYDARSITVRRGFRTELTFSQKCYSFASNTRSLPNCNDNHPVRYSECLGECVFGHSMQKCQCRLVDPYVFNETMKLPICSSDDFFYCFLKLEESYMALEARYERCKSDCKPCRFCTTQIFSSASEYSGYYENNTGVKIYLPLDYTLIEEVPSKTWEQFIAEIGGQLGLWIGGSILSVVQLIVFGVRFFYHKRCAFKRQTRVESIQIM